MSVGGVAGRVYAGGSAQRLDFESGVVGEAVQTGAVVEVVRLLRGVAFEGLLLFGDLLRDAAVAGRLERECVAQYGLRLGEFVGNVRGKEYFHGFVIFGEGTQFSGNPEPDSGFGIARPSS